LSARERSAKKGSAEKRSAEVVRGDLPKNKPKNKAL
jgi:hypothetical protein